MGLIATQAIDIKMFRGDDHTVEVTVRKKSSTPPYPLVIQNTSGVTAFLTVKKRASDTPLFMKSGVVVGDGTTGKLSFGIVPADTVNLTPTLYAFDVQIIIAGKVYTVVRGNFILNEDITLASDVIVPPPPVPPVPAPSFARAFLRNAPAAADVVSVHVAHLASDANAFPSPVNPVTPRNLQVNFGVGWDGGSVTVVGTTQFDEVVSEVFTAAPGSTVVGLKPFKTITTVTKGALGTTGSASVGVGNKFGVEGRLFDSTSAVLFVDNVSEAAVLDDTYDAFTPTTLPDGVVSYLLLANVTE